MTIVACSRCKKPYPIETLPYRCNCGGSFDFLEFPKYTPRTIGRGSGLSEFSHLLGLADRENLITLGEGNTPLLTARIAGQDVFLKMDNQNPTGSYKDRGTAVLISFLRSRGVTSAVEDSSGNAGASFAAYCARAGIRARVFIPASASGPKRAQIEAYGAELVLVPGPRQAAAEAVLREVESGAVYASHAWMPFGLPGIATMAYEIVEQLGQAPATLIAPVGHGGLLYGLMRGFESMAMAGVIHHEPEYIGVQSAACGPITHAFQNDTFQIADFASSETAAEGVKVTQPVRAGAILQRLGPGRGRMISIHENQLMESWKAAACQGIHIEPTSALVWAAISESKQDFKTPVVAVITGSGYKSSIQYK